MRVVDRRKGLPVALGILYLHAARAQGWDSVGLGFPGHFLVRLTEGAERLDPRSISRRPGVRRGDAARIAEGDGRPGGRADAEHYAPVADRDVLLRLQNNLKSRLLQAGRHERALRTVETMLLLAPDLAELWQERGCCTHSLQHARRGQRARAVHHPRARGHRPPSGGRDPPAAQVEAELKSKKAREEACRGEQQESPETDFKPAPRQAMRQARAERRDIARNRRDHDHPITETKPIESVATRLDAAARRGNSRACRRA